ncbi:hypothetical protein KW789_00950 [Candidatus Saccharibacteria bacterium]|jgi:hypothetical protein|nr:hypothetical protein [Candidatus Saccharibacteria bacterium]
MKVNAKLNTKALQISATQSRIIGVVVLATIITVFSLVSTKALVNKGLYQRRVINARHNSANKLDDAIKNANTLVTQYNNVFVGNDAQNVLGGKNTSDDSAVPPDGNNGRIVLDALPTTYDFPALLTSMAKILTNAGINTPSIGGTDQAGTITNEPSPNPQPANIDLTISGTGNYTAAVKFINDLQRSIRPIDITSLRLDGSESSLTININLTTYYQPAKTILLSGKEIK